MKISGILMILGALCLGAYGFNLSEPSAYESLLDKIERQYRDLTQGGYVPSNSSKKAHDDRVAVIADLESRRERNQNLSFLGAGVLFLAGVICSSVKNETSVTSELKRTTERELNGLKPLPDELTTANLPAPSVDIRSKLTKLAELRDAQLISSSDYESQKQKLLNDLTKSS